MAEKIAVRMLEDGHGICRGIDRDTGLEIHCGLDETMEIAEDTAEVLISTGTVEYADTRRERNRLEIRVVDSGYGIGEKNQVRRVGRATAERWFRRGIAVREEEKLTPLVQVEVLEDDPKLGSRGRRFRIPKSAASYLVANLLVKIVEAAQPAAV